MMRTIENPQQTFSLQGDVYRAQYRPGYGHLYINQDYEGVSVIDIWSGEVILSIPFTQQFVAKGNGIIDAWCLRADGNALLVMNEEERQATLHVFGAGETAAYDLETPERRTLADLRYCWESDAMWLSGSQSPDYFLLDRRGKIPVFIKKSGIKARMAQKEWVEALDKLPLYDCNVLRVQSEQGRMLYHNYSEGVNRLFQYPQTDRTNEDVPNRPAPTLDTNSFYNSKPKRSSGYALGMINWRDNTNWSIQAPEGFLGVTFHEDRLFILHEEGVRVYNAQGDTETFYPVPASYECRCFDVVPATNENPAALVMLCNPASDIYTNQVRIYSL